MCSVKRLTLTASGGALLILVLAAAPAHAQYGSRGRSFSIPGVGSTLNPFNYYDPFGSSRQAAFNIALYGRATSQVPAYAPGYNPYSQLGGTGYGYGTPTNAYGGAYGGSGAYNTAAYSSPSYTNSAYGTGYGTGSSSYTDPDSAFLQAAASVINADGRFRINNQEANLQRQKVRSAHIEANRKAFDEFLYERSNTPTRLDDLERQMKLNLRYALTNASGTEILTGSSLNTLLDSLKQMQSKGVQGPDVALSGETLDKINLSTGSGVNPALLKSERLTWPLGLTGTEFQDDRVNIGRNLAAAVRRPRSARSSRNS